MTNKMKLSKTESEWKEKLTKEQYRVLREKGTEIPFTGKLLKNKEIAISNWNFYDATKLRRGKQKNSNKEKGVYVCAGCGNELFSSDAKFDSHCGWPSFFESVKDKVEYEEDDSNLMKRIEIKCKKCGGHLGHVFDDAPKTPTGKRYCVNSVALGFVRNEGFGKRC